MSRRLPRFQWMDWRSVQPGQMQSFEMRNLNVTSSVTFNYTILPLRAGTLQNPATNHSRGWQFAANRGADAERQRQLESATDFQPTARRSNPRDIALAEMIVPKKNVYVGELVPVEIRLRIDSRVRFDPNPVAAGPRI